MRHEILVPRLSETAEEGILVTWFVEPGQPVKAGDPVAEVQIEKMASEVTAPATGRVTGLLAAQGDVVTQGALLAVVESAEEAGATASPASPAARRLARELGIDIATVRGTGPAGRIVEADVQRAADGVAPAPTAALTAPAAPPAPATTRPPAAEPWSATASTEAGPVPGLGHGWRVEPLPAIRRAIGERLLASVQATAQLTITAEADVTDLAAALEEATTRTGRSHGILGVTIRAVALALRDHPALTAAWVDDGLAFPEQVDVGCAVALADGLVVPVVRDPAARSVVEIEAEVADLAARAREGRLAPADTTGACISVTNLGAHRVDAFTPLLNPPQTAILGLGRARLRPAVVGGAIVPRRLAVLSLTFDHRVVDGKPAAAFLDALLQLLESPDRLLEDAAGR